MTRLLDLAAGMSPDCAPSMMAQIERLYPLCRSITGDGLRATLDVIGEDLPLVRHEVATGTAVLDWTVPKEWNIRDAYVADATGRRVIDFRDHNLHVVNYSVPVRRTLPLAELRGHLHTLPDHPDWIPYRTSYYNETWGFCLRHRDFEALEDGEYEVVIDSTLEDGHLSYGELLLPGETDQEVLLSTHVCHPSMCNDNLSGIAVLTQLAKTLMESERKYSYRILFAPGTIGAITWLARNREVTSRIRHGLVLAGLGDQGPFTYKRTRAGDAAVDVAVEHVFQHGKGESRVVDFSPYGYDERQYNSPGFALSVGRFSRSEYASYPQYHTSADDLNFISADALLESLHTLVATLGVLDADGAWVNTSPHGEPQLGRRGLYDDPALGRDLHAVRMALLWVLNFSDGQHRLSEIAQRAQLPFVAIAEAARRLAAAGLLEPQREDTAETSHE